MPVRPLLTLLLLIFGALASGCGTSTTENAKAEKLAAAKQAADRNADADKTTADKAAAEKAALDKAAADKAAADKLAAEKQAAADKLAAEKAALDKAAAAKRVDLQVLSKMLGEYLYQNKLKLTGGVGSNGSFSAKGNSWSTYRDSLHNRVDADQALRALHEELWRIIDQKKWDVQGPRKLPDERTYSFELRFRTVGNADGVMVVSFLPFEGKWVGEEKKAARLEIKMSEFSKK